MPGFYELRSLPVLEAAKSLEVLEAEDLRFWRQIGVPSPFQLQPYIQSQMINLSIELYRRNLLAFRSIENTKDFVIGGGITFEADDPAVQSILEDHWNHPLNQWASRLEPRVVSLGLTGELLLTVTETLNGDVLIGFIHPSKIDALILDPVNEEEVSAIRLLQEIEINGRKTKTLEVVHFDSERKRLGGDCFYFAINRPAPNLRGMSDLFAGIDLLYLLERFLHNRAHKATLVNAFIYDVTVRGAPQKKVDELRAELKSEGTKPGRFYVHDEMVSIDVVSPKLGGEDASADFRLIKNFVLGGFGIPEHWFGEAGTAGRAIGCFPVNTEILTENGWRKHFEINGLRLATVNPETGAVSWQFPVRKFMGSFDGLLHQFSGSGIKLTVTPEHKLLTFRGDRNPRWRFRKAAEQNGKAYFRTAPLIAVDPKSVPEFFRLPGAVYHPQSRQKEIPDRMLELRCWLDFLADYIAEGYLLWKGFPIRICQKPGSKLDAMRATLFSLSFRFGECDNGNGVRVLTIHDKALHQYLSANVGCRSKEKRIPKWIFSLPTELLQCFLSRLISGDGYYRKDRNGSGALSTNSEQLAKDYQALLFLCGHHSRVKTQHNLLGSWFCVPFSKEFLHSTGYHSTVPYSGEVFCYEVEPFHTLVSREDGCVVISGNSEMSEPVHKRLVNRQNLIKSVLEQVFKLAIDAKTSRSNSDNLNTNFKIKMPKIAIRDFQRLSGAFAKALGAALSALASDVLTKQETREFLVALEEQLGLGIPLKKEGEE